MVEAVRPYIIHYGYWAVFFGVFLESLGLPLPGETLIIVAGLVAAKGILNFSWVVMLAIMATYIANNISYAAGYFGGRDFVLKYGKYIFINETRLEVLENFFKEHGSKVVTFARFIIGMRQFNGFIAGMAKMPLAKFTVFNMVGAILWVVWWTGIAYYCGKKFDNLFIKYYFFIGVLGLMACLFFILRFTKNKDKS